MRFSCRVTASSDRDAGMAAPSLHEPPACAAPAKAGNHKKTAASIPRSRRILSAISLRPLTSSIRVEPRELLNLEPFQPTRSQFCFTIGEALGARQSETQSDGLFCAYSCAKSLDRIPDTLIEPSLDLVTKSLRQNGSELVESALVVKLQQVVPVQAESADWCLSIEAGMGSMPVVAVLPFRQICFSLV